MQATSSGGQKMANAEVVRSPNWSTYNMPARNSEAACTIEPGSGGMHESGRPIAAPARIRSPANRQIR